LLAVKSASGHGSDSSELCYGK